VVGDASCLVNPEDPADIMRGIVRVLEDEPYRKELILRGLKRARSFCWDRAFQRIQSVYDFLLAANSETMSANFNNNPTGKIPKPQ